MQFSWCLGFVSLLTPVLAQVNLTLVVEELPTCALICAGDTLSASGCALQNISSCLCTNVTLQGQLSVCVQTTCNRTEQYATLAVSQNLICEGVPEPSRSTEIIRKVSIISAVAFPIVILRLFSRYLIRRIWWDDWAIIGAAASMVPISVFSIYAATKGFGKHAWDVPPGNVNTILEVYYIAQILYVLVQTLAKISILLLFLRIFPGERFRLVTKIALVWMICHTIAFFMAVTLQCLPVRAAWDLSQKGKCISASAVVAAGAGISIFEDVVIVLLPIPELKKLNLSLRKRLAVMCMLALGSFACVTSMIRLKYLTSYSVQELDESWQCVDIVIWSILETYTAVICACLMTMRPLLAKFIPSIFESNLASSQHLYHNSSRPYSTQRTFSTRNPRRMDSETAEPGWASNSGSAVELKHPENGKVWTDRESSHGEGQGKEGPLEVWVTKSVDVQDPI